MCWKLVKGGYIWLGTREKESTWIQCQCCGKLYQVDRKIPISISIVRTECPRCEEYSGLNVGYDQDEIYLYMNPNVDERFFNY